jgi:polyisoprenoid-binding protein YceI
MRLSRRCLLRIGVSLFALVLCSCASRAPAPARAAGTTTLAPHLGTPYTVDGAASLLTIRAYRGGTLGAAGHNHVIASHALTGTIYATPDPLRSSFEVHLPLESLTVDEEALRADEHSGDFPPGVPQSARDGTRRNMLGEQLLDAGRFPEIVLHAVSLTPGDSAGVVQARVQATVRGGEHEFSLPVSYQRSGALLTVSGETALKQSELGLKPFSALLGALQVQDEMRLRFRIVARAGSGP